MAGFTDLERGAPGTDDGGDKGFGSAVIGWGFGWVHAAIVDLPARLRHRGLLFLIAAALTVVEVGTSNKGPRRAGQWARAISGGSSDTIDIERLRDAFGIAEP